MASGSDESQRDAALREEIQRIVREASEADRPINASQEARRVALKFPGIHTYAELAEMIIRASTRTGGSAIEIGDNPEGKT